MQYSNSGTNAAVAARVKVNPWYHECDRRNVGRMSLQNIRKRPPLTVQLKAEDDDQLVGGWKEAIT